MKHDINLKLWVVKFCLKLTYPKFNSLPFLVFLAVKFRKQYKKKMVDGSSIDTFKIKTIPVNIQRHFVNNYLEDNIPVLLHKCLIISRGQFMELASENLFYLDNGLLWMALKLSPSNIKKLKQTKNRENQDKFLKYNLNFVASEVHKKLWESSSPCPYEKFRIVPVVGSKHVAENVICTTESELHNIMAPFSFEDSSSVDVCFHPVPKLESAPKIAAAAEVSLIVNDYDLSNDFVKEILSNHFEVPKLIHINDIFYIDLTPEITAKYHYKYADLVQTAEKLYFKCLKINSNNNQEVTENFLSTTKNSDEHIDPPFFIVKGVTHLTLGESLHKLKPKDEYFQLKETETEQVQLLRNCPKGLKKKFDQIQETIAPFLSGDLNEITSSLSSPIMPMLLLTGSTGSGRHVLVKTLAKYNGMNCLPIDCNALQSSTAKQTESKISATIQRAKATSPVIILLDNFEVFAVDPENNEDCRLIEYFLNSLTDLFQNYTKHAIIFIAVTERADLKPNILRLFLEKFHIPKFNAQQRYDMLQWFASVMQLKLETGETEKQNTENSTVNLDPNTTTLSKAANEVLERVAAKTETFMYGDLDTLIHFALRESYLQQHDSTKESPSGADIHVLQEEHFNSALESMRSLQSQHLDAPNIPKVHWEDIGGLEKLKKELLKTIEFPIKYPHLFKNSSLKRSGILLYGPPGCGKTLVAKAVSTELNVSFLSVKGPELLNMYIGQSEENVRRVFETARASSPCIVFLDELDAMAARRGASGDSGGASDRLVSQLLAELDGVTTQQDADTSSFVFVMGATNRPDLLEQSLLRPGRLDKLIYVGPYCGDDEKTRVLTALSRSHNLRPEVKLREVAAALPDRCTGADLLQVVSTARSAAVRRLVGRLQDGLVKESELSLDSVIIGVAEMWEGVESFRPSVTDEELAHYESLQTQM